MANLIKWFSFSKELSGGSRSALVVVLSIAPLGWFPTVEGLYFLKTVWDGLFFVIVYSLITWILYLFVGNRIVSKQVTMDTLAMILCTALLMIQNGILIYLYSFRIFVSKSSLCISIPASLLIAVICVELWVQISNKNRKKVNKTL